MHNILVWMVNMVKCIMHYLQSLQKHDFSSRGLVKSFPSSWNGAHLSMDIREQLLYYGVHLRMDRWEQLFYSYILLYNSSTLQRAAVVVRGALKHGQHRAAVVLQGALKHGQERAAVVLPGALKHGQQRAAVVLPGPLKHRQRRAALVFKNHLFSLLQILISI